MFLGTLVHYLPTIPYSFTAQKTTIDIFTAVRTSNLIFVYNKRISETDLRGFSENYFLTPAMCQLPDSLEVNPFHLFTSADRAKRLTSHTYT
jgi:hypothetical protein